MMLEELCRSDMRYECRLVVDNVPLVRLKGSPWKKLSKFDDFFNAKSGLYDWRALPLQHFTRARKDNSCWKCWRYFVDNGKKIVKAFIRKKYGSTECAMQKAKTFDALFDEFLDWFKERRDGFMENIAAQLNEKKAELASVGKLPQSHGGVANLLKVLTKTMYTRGASIHTVAKVQYAVCMQAGIYIPDEFLTDVLVAADIIEEDGNEHP